MTVPLKTWHESCTCPGAEEHRRRLDEDGIDLREFNEMWDDARQRSRDRKEAFQAARARANSRSRDEIRDIYIAELTQRGLKIPNDAVLEAVVEHILGNPLPAVRLAAESVVQIGKGLVDLSRLFRSDS